MSRRVLIMIGLVLATAVASGAVAATRTGPDARPGSDDVTTADHADREQRRPLVPRPSRTPDTREDDDAQRQSGSTEGGGVHIERETVHHRVSGSGSIAVTSGAVDEGSGGNERHGTIVGPRPRRR